MFCQNMKYIVKHITTLKTLFAKKKLIKISTTCKYGAT